MKGKTFFPGFIDLHNHFGMMSNTMGQVNLNSSPVGNVESIKGIIQKMKAFKIDNNVPDGKWKYFSER